jgi:hypothetical protein
MLRDRCSNDRRKPLRWSGLWIVILALNSCLLAEEPRRTSAEKISLSSSVVVVDPAEPSFVQYAAQDVARYLGDLTGTPVAVAPKFDAGNKDQTVFAIGNRVAESMGVQLGKLSGEGSIVRTLKKNAATVVVIAGKNPHGTNTGVASLLRMIRLQGPSPYMEGPIDLRNEPSFSARGIHLNGWPLNHPYAFRSWNEEEWKRFIDIAWAQRINLFYLWPFMEILPVPLSKEDEAYLNEVRRVVDYAKNQRGMEVWIMQSANRIGTSDCKTPDPRVRPYWVNECQKDMNPADPQQFERIMTSFAAFYKIVNNGDAYCMIDSDPGGWPQSPVSDQVKIFNGARKLLDQYSEGKSQTKLIDWMHVGWGRHKFFTSSDSVVAAYDWTDKNPDESDVAFMGSTIRTFKKDLREPWGLIAGQPPYLPVVQEEGVLGRTIYLPYGAIESEPAFPATNLGQESVRKVFDKANQYPGLRGVMGNNQLMLLQFPRTFYFFATAWDKAYEQHAEKDVMLDLGTQLYPDQAQLIADSFLALRATDVEQISKALTGLDGLLQKRDAGSKGAIGRFVFPDHLSIIRNLKMQLEIRSARQTLLKALAGKPDIRECSRLLQNYLDTLLAWNKETGWNKMIEITVWPRPIYEGGKDFTEGMYRLKQLLAQDAPYTSYAKVDAFFDGISKELLEKYDQDSVMVGCVDPLKLAVIQSQ